MLLLDIVTMVIRPNVFVDSKDIPARLLKETTLEITPSSGMTLLFQTVDQGKIPDGWKTTLVTPVFKKGDK